MLPLHLLVLAQTMNLNGTIPLIRMPDGGMAARIWNENAITNVNVSGGGAGGTGSLSDGGYVIWGSNTSGSQNERNIANGQYTVVDTSVAGTLKLNWSHGLTCGAGFVLTSNGTGAMQCVSTISSATTATSATTAGSASTATALAANPVDCGAGQYATTIAANGDLTCAQVAYSQISGTPTIPADTSGASFITKVAEAGLSNEFALGTLATGILKNTTTTGVPTIAVSGTDYAPATSGSAILKGNGAGGFAAAVSGTDYEPSGAYSGVGSCGANQFATTLNDTAAPTCTQPAFSNLSGSATTAQLPTITVPKGGTNLTTVAANQVLVGTAADTFTAKTLPNCLDSGGNHLNFDNTTQTWSCGTSGGAGGGVTSVTGSTFVGSTGGTTPVISLNATGTPSASTFLRGDNTWATPAGGGGSSNWVSDTVTFGAGKYDATKTVTAAWASAGSTIICTAEGEEASVEGLVVTVVSKTSGSFVVRAEPRNGRHTGALPFTCTGI